MTIQWNRQQPNANVLSLSDDVSAYGYSSTSWSGNYLINSKLAAISFAFSALSRPIVRHKPLDHLNLETNCHAS